MPVSQDDIILGLLLLNVEFHIFLSFFLPALHLPSLGGNEKEKPGEEATSQQESIVQTRHWGDYFWA